MLFSFCFCVLILVIRSQINPLGWTSSSLLEYVRSNITTFSNGTDYYLIDPDDFISNTTKKENLLMLLSSIFEKYNIKIIFIVIRDMYPFFGYEQNIFDLAKNFSVGLLNNDTLMDYMAIAFSIEDDAQGIVLGKTVKGTFTYGTVNGYLNAIHSDLEKKKYYIAFFTLLTYINDKKVLLMNSILIILLPLMIVGGLFIIVFSIWGIIFGIVTIIDDHKKAKSVQLLIEEFREKKKGKEMFETICVFCLEPFTERQMNVITDESTHSDNTNDTSIRYENVEIVQSSSQQDDVNECTHHMHVECLEQWREICECCPLCKENVDMIENTDEGREKIYHVIWNVQRKKYCCSSCCFPFKTRSNKK